MRPGADEGAEAPREIRPLGEIAADQLVELRRLLLERARVVQEGLVRVDDQDDLVRADVGQAEGPARHDAVRLEGLQPADEVEQQVVVGLAAPDLLDLPLGAGPEDQDGERAVLAGSACQRSSVRVATVGRPVSRSYNRVRSLSHLPRRATNSLSRPLFIGWLEPDFRIAPRMAAPGARPRGRDRLVRAEDDQDVAAGEAILRPRHEPALESRPACSRLDGEDRDAVAAAQARLRPSCGPRARRARRAPPGDASPGSSK